MAITLAFDFQRFCELSALLEVFDGLQASDELTLDEDLRIGWPVRVFLQAYKRGTDIKGLRVKLIKSSFLPCTSVANLPCARLKHRTPILFNHLKKSNGNEIRD